MATETAQSPVDETALPPPLQALTDLVEERPEALADGDDLIRDASLAAAKFIFDVALKSESAAFPAIDALVRSVQSMSSDDIVTRSTAGRKRKRSEPDPSRAPSKITLEPTPLNELFLDGMGEEQIWEQLELRAKRVCTVAKAVLELEDAVDDEDGDLADSDIDLDEEEDLSEEEVGDSDEMSWTDEDDSEEHEAEDEEGEEEYGEEGIESLREEVDDDDDDDMDEDDDDPLGFFKPTPSTSKGKGRPKHPTLDDDFFSIDEFNRETEAMEARTRSAGHLDEDDEDDVVDEDVDLFNTVEEEAEVDQEPTYAEFFAPPRLPRPQKPRPPPTNSDDADDKRPGVRFDDSVRVKTIKPKVKRKVKLDFDPAMYPFDLEDGEGMELDEEDEDSEDGDYEDEDMDGVEDGAEWGGVEDEEDDDEDDEEDEEDEDFEQEETIGRLKDDLFGDDEDEAEQTNLSTHQQRLAAISEQIAALEAENVGKKDWTLMGEANARTRPVNSLLEEDLDFEHQGKQVPVVTEETTKGLEEMIKSRILAENFNDVIRKRPVDDKPFLPSRIFELQDSRSQKSLAQIYEDGYTAARAGGDTAVAGLDDRDGKLKKEHDEIEKMWEGIAYKLDALSNANFTPKAPKATITTISNVPVVSLESALPTTTSTSTLLAPEEVFSSDPASLRARSELTPSEKLTVRRREKRAHKTEQAKLGAAVDAFGKSGKKKGRGGEKREKEEAMRQIVKVGKGVTVVGKKGKERERIVPRAADLKL